MRKHIEYYLSFILILGAGLFLIFQSLGNNLREMEIVITLALFYAVWGIVHHAIHHSLGVKIFLEYILVGALGVAVVFFVIKGGL